MDELKEALKERLSHVFFGTLMFSWSAWNWRFWVVLTSGLPLDKKLSAVQIELSAARFFGPLLVAIGYAYFLVPGTTLVGKFVKTLTDNRLAYILDRWDRTAPTNFANAQIVAEHTGVVMNEVLQWLANASILDEPSRKSVGTMGGKLGEIIKLVNSIADQGPADQHNLRRHADTLREAARVPEKEALGRLNA